MDADTHERIRRRAYELWEQEGRPEGRAEEHWRQAATELRAETEAAGVHLGAGGDDDQGHAQAPSDLAADEAAEGGGGVGPLTMLASQAMLDEGDRTERTGPGPLQHG